MLSICQRDTGEAFSRISNIETQWHECRVSSLIQTQRFLFSRSPTSLHNLVLLTAIMSVWVYVFYISKLILYYIISWYLTPTGDWHQSRLVSCDRPNPGRALWLAGGGRPIRLLSGHEHSGHVDSAPPAECNGRCHLTVLPCTPSSHVSVCKNLLLLQLKCSDLVKFMIICM